MRHVPRLVVARPVLTIMAILIVVLLGLAALANLSVELLPRMRFPIAAAFVTYPGSSPSEMEDQVVRPLEEALSTVNNVKRVRSESRADIGVIMVEFNWGTDMDLATLQMRERIDRVKGRLPDGVDPPTVMKFDPQAMPVITLAVSGAQDAGDTLRMAEDVIKPRLERLDGVASVNVTGGRRREVQVRVDPDRLQLYGLSLDAVINALRATNLNVSGGSVAEGRRDLLIRTTGQFRNVAEIRDLALPLQGGVIHLRDLATVEETLADVTTLSRLKGSPSVGLSILKQTEANTVRVSRLVRRELEAVRAALPPGTEIAVVMDQADFVRQSIRNVSTHTVEGGLLAVAIIYLFLRQWPSTLTVASAIPISLLGAFALMYFSNLTLNMVSLGGLALGVGRLVDDAIVVLENIARHREGGAPAEEAAVHGSAEILGAITGVTLTTVAVFVPIVFVKGLAGEIFREMALSVTFALLASLFVAMTVIPLFSSRLLRSGFPAAGRGRGGAAADGAAADGGRPGLYARVQAFYARAILWALGHRRRVVLTAAGLLSASLAAIPLLGAEFMPRFDRGEITVSIRMPRGASLEATDRVVTEVERLALALPETRHVFSMTGDSTVGLSGSNASRDVGQVDIKLVPAGERRRGQEAVIEDLRRRVAAIPGARITVQPSGGLMSSGGPPITISVKGDDFQVVQSLADEVAARLRTVPGTREVETSTGEALPELHVVVDNERAASLGLSVAQVGQALRAAVEGVTATRYQVAGREMDVRVRLRDAAVRHPADLRMIPLTTPAGTVVPLSEVARLEPGRGPVAITRDGQARTVNVTGDLAGRSLAAVMADARAALAGLALPPGYSLVYGGDQQQMTESFTALGGAFLMALLLVYMILAAEFESLIHPFTIMVSVPLGLVGAVLGLLVTGHTLNVASFIGVIMLSGIVVSNAIVLIDYVILLRRRGVPRDEALARAGAVRLRPVLMTALATMLGLLPLALGLGEGSEFQAPMAAVVLFGLAVSTALTLIVLPVVYSLFDDLGRRLARRGGRGAPKDRPDGRTRPEAGKEGGTVALETV